MKDKIIGNIEQKTGIPHIAELLAGRLTGSELNSLLLEVFSQNLKTLTPPALLRQYRLNRFVHPAPTDMIGLLRSELNTLELLKTHGFQPIELSPAAQLGSCSVLATTDQKRIVSATRNTEIMADASNSLALHIADIKKLSPPPGQLRFCTVHRHIRSQPLKEKGHTAHFKIGCLVSSGRDTGDFEFESAALQEHFLALSHLFREVYGIERIRFKFQRREGYAYPDRLLDKVIVRLETGIPGLSQSREDVPAPNNYYKGLQFKMIIDWNGLEIEIADGGFVDWTQQLLGNKKERLLISGFGLGLLFQLQNGSFKEYKS
jgi:hypothetical protein